jgi:hypothetical protein
LLSDERRTKGSRRSVRIAATASKRCGCRACQRVEQQHFLAVAGRREHEHRPVRAEALAQFSGAQALFCGDRDVELQVAGDGDLARAEFAQSLGIRVRLGGDAGERCEQRPRQ